VLYRGEAPLAAELGAAQATLTSVQQSGGKLEFKLAGKDAEIVAPPFWNVERSADQFTLTPPETSAVREVDIVVRLGGKRGELAYRLPHK